MSLERTNVVDAMGIDEATGRVVMVLRHDGEWDGSEQQLYLLQEKLNAYISFALDGEMAEAHPEFVNRPVSVRVESTAAPEARTLHFLGHVRRQLQFQEIELEVRTLQSCHGK